MAKTAKQPAGKAVRSSDKVPRHRSPNYPSLDLRAAVDKLPGLFEAMKRHPVGVEVAVKSMGYSYNSSTGKLALAAFRAFGLFENVQTGNQATVKLSTRALDITADYPRESAHWWAAIKKAALAPNAHSQLWEKYGATLPADDEVRRYLVRELKFSDKAVDAFIQEYKATIDFANLSDSDIINGGNGHDDDERGGDGNPPTPSRKRRSMQPGMNEDVFSLAEGAIILQWPGRLSKVSAADAQDWLALIGRKIKRAAETPSDDDGEPFSNREQLQSDARRNPRDDDKGP